MKIPKSVTSVTKYLAIQQANCIYYTNLVRNLQLTVSDFYNHQEYEILMGLLLCLINSLEMYITLADIQFE